MGFKSQNFKLLTLSSGFLLIFCALCDSAKLIERVDNYIDRTKQFDSSSTSSTDFIQPSLFPNVPPYIKFAPYYKRPSIEIPAAIRDGLVWRRSPILYSGGYIVHYIMNKTGVPAFKLSKIEQFGPNISWFGYWHEIFSTTLIGPLHVTQTYQKYNFFQQASELEKKDRQHWNLMRLIEKHGRGELPFYLDTFVLPDQLDEFKLAWNNTENKLWVIKPPNGSNSEGVKVISHWSEVPDNTFTTVQKYLHNPYLFSGRKIEIRNYVLTTSFNPLRVYIFNDGDTKIGYKKFSSDIEQKDDLCIHSRPPNGHLACVEPYDVDDRHENFAKDLNFWENSRVLFWLALVVIAFSACVVLSLQSYNRFETKNTVVTIEKDHYYWNTSMPSITICPTINRISSTKFDAYCEKKNIKDNDKLEFYQFIESLANSTYTNFEDIKDFPSIEKLNIDPKDYMTLIYTLTEDWSRREEGERKVRAIFDLEFVLTEQILTEYGICYMTNSYLTKQLSTSMLIFGTPANSPYDEKYYQNYKLHEVVSGNLFDGDLNYNFVGFVDEIQMFLHSPYETINIAKLSYLSRFAVEFHCFTNEIVTDEGFQDETRISQRGCRFQSESNLTHYNFYTKGICLQECRLNVAYRICKCIPHFYPNKVAEPKPVCSYKQLKSCLAKHKDLLVKLRDSNNNAVYCPGCVQNCKDLNIFIDSFQVLEGTTDLLGTIGGLMLVKQYPMIRYKRKILFSFEDLIVSIGGTAGLFTGFCFLGAVEIIYFFTIRLFCLSYTIGRSRINGK